MRIITDCAGFSPANGLCLTIGNFDGVHLGHQALIARARSVAEKGGFDFGILTFWPHPRLVLPSSNGHTPLSTREARLEMLRACQPDAIIEMPFTRGLANLTPEEFANAFLAPMNLKELVIGHDFSLGKNRAGSSSVLEDLGRKHNFRVEQISGILVDGQPVSSSRLRSALGAGDVTMATKLLGRFYSLEGEVAHGQARGRLLGFPTANLANISTLLPATGVYATFAWINGHRFPAVTSIGANPTFGGQAITVESFILDEVSDLYGQKMRLEFVARLRDICKFSGSDELARQISADAAHARQILKNT